MRFLEMHFISIPMSHGQMILILQQFNYIYKCMHDTTTFIWLLMLFEGFQFSPNETLVILALLQQRFVSHLLIIAAVAYT